MFKVRIFKYILKRKKIFLISLFSIILPWLFFNFHFLYKFYVHYDEDLSNLIKLQNKMKFQGEKIVHLDLKGAPPKISYYKQFFKLLAKLGATGIIIEYEDMFPYHGHLLSNVSASNAYTLNDIKIINNLAKSMNLKIIPLIQTFGHMEFILKLEEWKHLREVPKYPLVVCPSHNGTLILIREMIEQIIKAHPNSKMIHIGADEVYLLGECDRCFVKMNINRWTKQKLFLHHVSTVANLIQEKYPNMRILMWDDEFRNVRQEDLEKWKIASLVEPVVWKYKRNVDSYLNSSLWDMYAILFPRIWIASAFKGALGPDKYTPDIKPYLDNHKSWMNVVARCSRKIKFEGIILTGWQRYDHFAVLCELLPVGIPSLAINLYFIQGYINSTLDASLMQCENPYAFLESTLKILECSFPGENIIEGVLKLQYLKKEFNILISDSTVRGWMSEYNINHQYSNLLHVQSKMKYLDMYKMNLLQIESELVNNMSTVYDNYTIIEWRETYIKPLNKQIESLLKSLEKLLVKDHWPKRPFSSDKIEP